MTKEVCLKCAIKLCGDRALLAKSTRTHQCPICKKWKPLFIVN